MLEEMCLADKECTMYFSPGMRFQQFDILTSVDSYEPVQPPLKLRNSK